MIWIGLPAYNESRRIKSLILDIDKSLQANKEKYQIVVYDDGSSDDTVKQIVDIRQQGINVSIVEGKINKGLGHALCYLISHCVNMSSKDDIVIIMDADATHNPEHIHRMIGYIKDGFDVVIASRYTPYSRIRGLVFYRRFLSNIANAMFRLLFPIKGVRDYSCSYRAYTAKVLKMAYAVYGDALIKERGFACMAELLLKLRKLDIIACEIPLILRYDKKAGATKMNVADTVIKTLRLIIKSLFLPKVAYARMSELRDKYEM